jgi:hypothetical protein
MVSPQIVKAAADTLPRHLIASGTRSPAKLIVVEATITRSAHGRRMHSKPQP